MKKHPAPRRTPDQIDLFGADAPSSAASARVTPSAAHVGSPSARGRQNPKAASHVAPLAAAPGALLNVRQAAARLGLSKSTLDKMRCKGIGPKFIKSTDRAVRYDPNDVDAWVAQRRRQATEKFR